MTILFHPNEVYITPLSPIRSHPREKRSSLQFLPPISHSPSVYIYSGQTTVFRGDRRRAPQHRHGCRACVAYTSTDRHAHTDTHSIHIHRYTPCTDMHVHIYIYIQLLAKCYTWISYGSYSPVYIDAPVHCDYTHASIDTVCTAVLSIYILHSCQVHWDTPCTHHTPVHSTVHTPHSQCTAAHPHTTALSAVTRGAPTHRSARTLNPWPASPSPSTAMCQVDQVESCPCRCECLGIYHSRWSVSSLPSYRLLFLLLLPGAFPLCVCGRLTHNCVGAISTIHPTIALCILSILRIASIQLYISLSSHSHCQ